MNRYVMGIVGALTCLSAGAAGEIAVKTAKPELVSMGEDHINVGRVVGSHQVDLTARVVGTLWERNGEEGKSVKKGDVLYRIEDTIYKANLQTARAKEAELAARLKQAEIDSERYSRGEASGGVSKTDRDKAVLLRDVAKAQLDAAKANVTLCENDLSYCTIASPIDGVLGRYDYDVGNNVGPETGKLRDVICVDPIDIVVAFPEQVLYWAFERRALRASVRTRLLRSDGAEIPLDLKVHAVDNKVDSSTGTVTMRFRAANPDRRIMPGGYVKLILNEVYSEAKLAVPMAAVVFEGDRRFLFVVKDGKATRREIELGATIDNRVFVTKGLSEGESFVSGGVHKLFDGAAVKEK